jgi:hypothetical protein
VNASVHDFAILEYRDTIGGRAWHKPFGKDKDGKPYIIEMGANWVRYQTRCDLLANCLFGLNRSKVLEIQAVLKILFGVWYVTMVPHLQPSKRNVLMKLIGPKISAEDSVFGL